MTPAPDVTVVLLERDKRPLRAGGPQRWQVTLPDGLVIGGLRDPEHEACRAMLDLGFVGRVTFVHADGMAGLTMDIEKGAGRTTDENTGDGKPRVRKYRPFPAEGLPLASADGAERADLPEAAE